MNALEIILIVIYLIIVYFWIKWDEDGDTTGLVVWGFILGFCYIVYKHYDALTTPLW